MRFASFRLCNLLIIISECIVLLIPEQFFMFQFSLKAFLALIRESSNSAEYPACLENALKGSSQAAEENSQEPMAKVKNIF